ncbi:phosphate ABC transporter substrate-binding protein [Pilimelia anulata]|uniref:Phosphate ABC transporter substrate-binding protein n=1 Tax=Pilimelia anulata TaxID=53371 RepID=A0A8J3BH14_9ACTN|nr:substrate-binding domain-containing protein [Pilimelia anulata]GGK03028.1 phosphate ABC transporter substrate-binding protein [Pilimelia anulata]
MPTRGFRAIVRTAAVGLAATHAAAGPLAAGPAAAAPAGDGVVQVLTAVGSDTTQDVVGAVLAGYAADRAANPDGDIPVNVPVRPAAPVDAPADATCARRGWVAAGQERPPATYAAPAGSGAGKAALVDPANRATACVDIARSSSGRAAGDPAELVYFGFARDAVSWARYPGAAPATLTLDQLRGIYSCAVTDWSAVGGAAGPIVRYLPPAASGTRAFFVGTLLGAEPSTACGPLREVPENDGAAVPAADRAAAILPYSAAGWVAQANGVAADRRGGAAIGALAGRQPVSGPDADGRYRPDDAVINGGFPGTRTVHHILDTRLPGHAEAVRAVGFDAAGPGYLCAGGAGVLATLRTYGFTPLPAVDGRTCTRS